jgi:hypothetical protein
LKSGRALCGEFLTQRSYRFDQIVGRRAWPAQIINGVASLRDRLVGTFERLFEVMLGFPAGSRSSTTWRRSIKP